MREVVEEKNRNFIGDEDEVWTRRPRQDETGVS